MNVLVVGGSGFIGRALVHRLALEQCSVRVLTRSVVVPEKQLTSVEYVSSNNFDGNLFAYCLSDIDLVVHAASTTTPGSSALDPIYDIESNLLFTIRLLQSICEQQRKIRLVYLSSGGTVYGPMGGEKLKETDPLKPISSYGVVKQSIENYINIFRISSGLNAVSLRISNPYGPGQLGKNGQGLIGTILNKTSAGEEIQIWGDGSAVRDYLYIGDVVEAIWLSMTSEFQGAVNIGSGAGLSINEVIKLVQDVIGSPVDCNYVESRECDVSRVVLNIQLAKKALDWEPAISARDGIQSHWCWIESALMNKSDL